MITFIYIPVHVLSSQVDFASGPPPPPLEPDATPSFNVSSCTYNDYQLKIYNNNYITLMWSIKFKKTHKFPLIFLAIPLW